MIVKKIKKIKKIKENGALVEKEELEKEE